jgi:hypothetical protein
MNNWNFNEVTQSDLYDFKACKHNVTGKIYGIKESASCQQGKEVDKAELNKLAVAANKGDMKAKKQLEEYRKADTESKKATKKAKAEAEAKKKKAEEEAGKKKKGGKGGKGKAAKGGKGKGGDKGKESGGKVAAQKSTPQSKAQSRQKQVESARRGVKALQDALASIKNPKQRERIEKKIADLLTQVSQLSMPNTPAGDTVKAPQAPAPSGQQQQQQKPDKA